MNIVQISPNLKKCSWQKDTIEQIMPMGQWTRMPDTRIVTYFTQ